MDSSGAMPSERGVLVSAVVNGSIYVFGGEQPAKTFNNNEKFDPSSNKWTSEKSIPTAIHGWAAVTFDSKKVYVVIAGLQPGCTGSAVNEVFHVVD